jgi:cytochrome c-type biogenesis protein CcmH/NrfF
MASMLGTCIAATTAFLVVNANNLGLQTFSLVVWLAPTIIGVLTIAIWTRYYRRKFAPAARRVATVSAA